MAITITQQPSSPFDQTYGPNPVTVTGVPVDPVTGIPQADKYVLQVYVNGGLVADMRQSPNRNAMAIFDIQNTLQNFVQPSAADIEQLGYIGSDLSNSARETTSYTIRASYENNGVVPNYPGDPGEWDETEILINFGGTKEYYEVPYSSTQFIPALYEAPVADRCTVVLKAAQPFTERTSGRRALDIAAAGEGIPSFLSGNTVKVIEQDVTVDDMTTTSFYNAVSGTALPTAVGIEAFVFYQYSGNTLLTTSIVPNIQANGGGPNVAVGDGLASNYPYRGITAATGPKNFQDFEGPVVTHYYVVAAPWTPAACYSVGTEIAYASLFQPMRFNIVDPNCSDFPEYQFSWLNKYGFRDYYSFNKRKDRNIAINRNTYLQEAADYGSTSYDVDIYDRGTTVYSQALQENFTAFTDYISDEDALYLEGLFTSPDVKVRFGDAAGDAKYQWVPVALLSTSYTEKTNRKDKLFQYDIKFKRAHNLKSQRG